MDVYWYLTGTKWRFTGTSLAQNGVLLVPDWHKMKVYWYLTGSK